MKPTKFQATVRRRLQELSRPGFKENYERYFQQVVRFHGVKTPVFRKLGRDLSSLLAGTPIEVRIRESLGLLASPYFEEKHIGIDILTRNHRKLPADFLRRLEPVFDRAVYDWATCDAISGRVLRHLIVRDRAFLEQIVSWSLADHPWRQRASAVAFVNEARHGRYDDEILTVCARIVLNPDRFVQLGMGWVLRELSLVDRPRVCRFLAANHHRINREALRYAIEKMPGDLREEILRAHAEARTATG